MTQTPAHIAFLALPATGHVNPTLAVVAELVRRGHRVSYATSEDFAARVAAAGATPVVCATAMPTKRDNWPLPLHDTAAMSDVFLRDAISALPDQIAAFDADRPDLIVYDYAAFGAQVLAERWGIPAVRTSPTHVHGPDYQDELDMHYFFLEQNPDWNEHRGRFQAFLDDNRMDISIDELIYRGRAVEYLVTLPREFQKDAEQLDDRYTFVGPCINTVDQQPGWERPADGRPVLLVAFGSVATSQPELLRMCVEAFRDSPWHVVMAIGDRTDREALGPLPENVEIHAYVPQVQVLAQAGAFITHAGMGSTLEGLYFGVPMVAVPQFYDQLDNARLLTELGLGVGIAPEEVTADGLRSAVSALTEDPEVARRLARMRESVRAAGGATAAADLLEKCLSAL